MLLSHGLQYLLARGIPGVINFLAIALYTRLISPEQYGAYTLTVTAVSATDALLLHWLRLALLRFLPKSEVEATGTLATILRLYALFSLGVGVLAVLLGAVLINDSLTRQLIYFGALLFVVQGAFELTVERERSELSPQRYGLYMGIRSIIGLATGVGLAIVGLGAFGLLMGLVAAMVVPLFALGGAARWLHVARGHYSAARAREILIYGGPLAATSVLAFVVSGSDRFMLAAMVSTATAGQYAVGYDLAQFTLGLLLSIVNLAAYPLIIKAFEQEGEESARRMLRWTLRLMLLIGLPAAVGLSVLSPNVASVLVGAEFKDAATAIIPGIAIAALISGVKVFYFDLSFQLKGNTLPQVWVLLVTASLNVALNLVLIPPRGIEGAVLATIAAHVVGLLLAWWWGRGSFRVPLPSASTIPIVVATGVMLAGLSTVRHLHGPIMLALQILLGIVLYFGTLLIADRKRLRWVFLQEG